MEHYVSGEEHQEGIRRRSKLQHKNKPPYVWIAVVIIAMVASSLGMFAYLKHGGTNSSGSSASGSSSGLLAGGPACGGGGGNQCMGSGPSGGQMSGPPPISGTVTAVSATSITIQSQDGTQTFSITSSTQEGVGPGQPNKSYSPNDIHIGQVVGLVTAPNNPTQVQILMAMQQVTSPN